MRMKVLVHWGQEESTKVIKSTLPRSRHSNAPIHRAPLATMRHTGIQRCGSARNAEKSVPCVSTATRTDRMECGWIK